MPKGPGSCHALLMIIFYEALMTEDSWRQDKDAAEAAPDDEVLRLRKQASAALGRKDARLALELTAQGKRLKIPCLNLDFLRGAAFLVLGAHGDAYEALKEELRWFPDNRKAEDLLQTLEAQMPNRGLVFKEEELQQLYEKIRPHTMLSPARIRNLFLHAKEVCERGPEGNIVECGVAGGGTSGLLAYVFKSHGGRERKLFCCDSFAGMPPASPEDSHNGTAAEDTGWGTGTCAAPEESVISLCRELGAADIIEIVKGYFEETLPLWKKDMGGIALLHMDGDWYSSTRAILDNLYDSLVPGAFIQIDDYGYWDGCKKAVHEFEQARGLRFVLHPIDGTGVWLRKN